MTDDAKTPDHVQIYVACDGCDASLLVEARSREAAHEAMRTQVIVKGWRVVDRLDSTVVGGPRDLCPTCAAIVP